MMCMAMASMYWCSSVDIGKLFGDFDNNGAPELRDLKHVGLVDAGKFFAALLRDLEGDAGDAGYFVTRVDHGVVADALGHVALARLAEVSATEELADEHDIGAFDDFGRKGLLTVSSLNEKQGRRLANLPSAARRPSRPASGRLSGGRVLNSLPPTAPSRTASIERGCERVRGQGRAVVDDGDAADALGVEIERVAAEGRDFFQDRDCFVGDFGADAVAGGD